MVLEQFPNATNHYYLRWHFKLISNNFFPKNEEVQAIKISTLVTCGLNNPEACYQSLNVIIIRQLSSSNRISQSSNLILVLSMRSSVTAKRSATLTHSRVQR